MLGKPLLFLEFLLPPSPAGQCRPPTQLRESSPPSPIYSLHHLHSIRLPPSQISSTLLHPRLSRFLSFQSTAIPSPHTFNFHLPVFSPKFSNFLHQHLHRLRLASRPHLPDPLQLHHPSFIYQPDTIMFLLLCGLSPLFVALRGGHRSPTSRELQQLYSSINSLFAFSPTLTHHLVLIRVALLAKKTKAGGDSRKIFLLGRRTTEMCYLSIHSPLFLLNHQNGPFMPIFIHHH